MDFVKRYWTQILSQLEGLTATQKWLIGCLLIIMLLVGFLLLQYAGQPELATISGFAGSQADQAVAQLKAQGIDASLSGGQLQVPVAQQDQAIAMLVQNDLLTDDTSAAFKKLITNQSPWITPEQSDRAFLIAKQQVLSAILRKMNGVRSAAVVISMPQNVGFGTTHVQPTASVTLTMRAGHNVNRHLVRAAAGLVSGAVAEMKPQDVVVIDSNQGQQYTVPPPGEMQSSEIESQLHKAEQYQQQKILGALRFIPKVIVAVRVTRSDVNAKTERSWVYQQNQPLNEESTSTTSRQDVSNQGQPGAAPNTGISIPGSGANGTSEKTSTSKTSYDPAQLTGETNTVYNGQTTKQINVSISVPRSYMVGIYKQQNPKAKGSPTSAQLAPIVQQQLATIKQQVQPLLAAQMPGTVQVAMYPDQLLSQPMTAGSGAAGVSAVLASNWMKPVVIGGLALLSLALMLGMVRKATRSESLPTVEELAGVPASLPIEEELVGEADEYDAGMAGVELDDDQLKNRQVAEQISEMIKANPEEASSLLGKWVNFDNR